MTAACQNHFGSDQLFYGANVSITPTVSASFQVRQYLVMAFKELEQKKVFQYMLRQSHKDQLVHLMLCILAMIVCNLLILFS